MSVAPQNAAPESKSQNTETVCRETGRMTFTSRLHDYSTPIAGNILRVTERFRTDCACNASLGGPAWIRKFKSPPATRTQHSGTERPENTTSDPCSYRTCGRFVSPLCDLRRTDEKAPRHSACFSVEPIQPTPSFPADSGTTSCGETYRAFLRVSAGKRPCVYTRFVAASLNPAHRRARTVSLARTRRLVSPDNTERE